MREIRLTSPTQYQLIEDGCHLITFAGLADLQQFSELVTSAVELAEY